LGCGEGIGRAGHRFDSHNWRGHGDGTLGGGRCADAPLLERAGEARRTEAARCPNEGSKFRPSFSTKRRRKTLERDCLSPGISPIRTLRMSSSCPHFLKRGARQDRCRIFFHARLHPVWTFPDGFRRVEMLRDETKIGCTSLDHHMERDRVLGGRPGLADGQARRRQTK